jgi:acyl-CoA thioesterase
VSEDAKKNLDEALTLTRRGDEHEANLGADWAQGRAAFGGIVAALGLRALSERLPAERALRSLMVDFIAPVAPGPVVIEARVLREGRALTHGEARIVQEGEVCAVLVGAFGAARETLVRVPGAAPPPSRAVDELPRLPYVEGRFPRFTQHFEYRWTTSGFPFSGSAEAKLGGYVRHAGPAPSDLAGLLCLIDAWPPAVLPLLHTPAPASSVTWMVDVLAPEAVAAHRWDAFYRYEAETVAAGDGYGSVESRTWAPDGTLVAAARQLVVEFSADKQASKPSR